MASRPMQIVSAPAIPAQAVGLIPTIRAITGDDAHWQGGFTFEPNGCIPAVLGGGSCTEGVDFDASDFPRFDGNVPGVVLVAAHCTALEGANRDNLGARVAAQVELRQGKTIERELWRGDRAQAEGLANLYLAGGSPAFENLTPGPTATSPGRHALAALQMYLADCSDTGRGFIHATRATITMWLEANVIRREGALLLDAFDNWIIAGAGYDGSDPDGDVDETGDTAYAYATGVVDVRLGAITPIPGLNEIQYALDLGNNDLLWQAWRYAAATWDGCCHAGVRVGICETCCTPSTSGS